MTVSYLDIFVGFKLSLNDLILLLKSIEGNKTIKRIISDYNKCKNKNGGDDDEEDDDDDFTEFLYGVGDILDIKLNSNYNIKVKLITHDVCEENNLSRYTFVFGICIGSINLDSNTESNSERNNIQKIDTIINAKVALEEFMNRIKNMMDLPDELNSHIFDYMYDEICVHYVQDDCRCCS